MMMGVKVKQRLQPLAPRPIIADRENGSKFRTSRLQPTGADRKWDDTGVYADRTH